MLAKRFWTAVKTGTSKDMRDNWAVGWSHRYTVGVWVGNASDVPMWDVSGTTGAAPIWAAVMNYLHQTQPSRAPQPPAGVVQAAVQFAAIDGKASSPAPLEAARKKWFLQGTQQNNFAINSIVVRADRTSARGQKCGLKNTETQADRIAAPTTGTIIALDPDIPPNRQRVSFQAEGANLRWLMDGKVFGKGASAQWLLWPGRHVVQITGERGAGVNVSQAGAAGKR